VADWPWPSRVGVASAGLGLVSVLTLCLPVVGYLATFLCGVGLLPGLGALGGAMLAGTPGPGVSAEGGAPAGLSLPAGGASRAGAYAPCPAPREARSWANNLRRRRLTAS
jgi:hypothetical protein